VRGRVALVQAQSVGLEADGAGGEVGAEEEDVVREAEGVLVQVVVGYIGWVRVSIGFLVARAAVAQEISRGVAAGRWDWWGGLAWPASKRNCVGEVEN